MIFTLGNTELFVVPIVLVSLFKVKGTPLMIFAGIIGTLEMLYWWWYSGWITRREKETRAAREVKTIVKDGISEMKQTTMWLRAEQWLYYNVVDIFSRDHYEGFYRRLFDFILGLGWFFGGFTVFLITAFPFPLIGWAACVVLCRVTGWKLWIFALFFGNAFKNSVGYAWFMWDGGWRDVLQFIKNTFFN